MSWSTCGWTLLSHNNPTYIIAFFVEPCQRHLRNPRKLTTQTNRIIDIPYSTDFWMTKNEFINNLNFIFGYQSDFWIFINHE